MNPAATLSGRSAPLASAFCLFGFFLHILLSDPLMQSLGLHYNGEEGAFYEKIHPGSWFIFVSFALLLWQGLNPLRQSYLIARDQMAYGALLIITLCMFGYMVLRSGAGGTAFLLDTHLTVPICAIVLCYAPYTYCRRALYCFLLVAVLNAGLGIAETLGQFRIFTFDPDISFMQEQYFRASALRGHPLNNAMFTALALFILLACRWGRIFTLMLVMLFFIALVAFGGRAALAYSVFACSLYGAIQLWRWFNAQALTPLRWLQLFALLLLVPAGCFLLLYGALETPLGARILAHGLWDESAKARQVAPLALQYMKQDELWFGVSMPQTLIIVARLNQIAPLASIENPWLLMFMMLGGIVFPVWLVATLAFARRLMRHQPLALQLAVLGYYVIASTSNSFGRKDSTYLIMVCAVLCATAYRQLLYSPASSPKQT